MAETQYTLLTKFRVDLTDVRKLDQVEGGVNKITASLKRLQAQGEAARIKVFEDIKKATPGLMGNLTPGGPKFAPNFQKLPAEAANLAPKGVLNAIDAKMFDSMDQSFRNIQVGGTGANKAIQSLSATISEYIRQVDALRAHGAQFSAEQDNQITALTAFNDILKAGISTLNNYAFAEEGLVTMSNKLTKAFQSEDQAALRVQRSLNNLEKRSDGVNQSLDVMSGMAAGLMFGQALLTRSITGIGFSLLFMKFNMVSVAFATSALVVAMGMFSQSLNNVISNGVAFVDQLTQWNALLNRVNNSTTAGAQAFQFQQDMARKYGLTLQDAGSAMQRWMEFQIIGADNANKLASATANLAAATGQSAEESARAIGMGIREGSLTQLERHYVRINGLTSKQFEELTMLEREQLVLTSIEKQYGGAAEAKAKTVTGAITRIKTALQGFYGAIGAPIVQAIIAPLLDRLAHFFEKLADFGKALSESTPFINAVNQLLGAINGLLEALGLNSKTAGDSIRNFLGDGVIRTIYIITFFIQALTKLVLVLRAVAEAVIFVLRSLKPLADFIMFLARLLKQILDGIIAFLRALKEHFELGWLWDALRNGAIKALGDIIKLFPEFLAEVGKFVDDISGKFIDFLKFGEEDNGLTRFLRRLKEDLKDDGIRGTLEKRVNDIKFEFGRLRGALAEKFSVLELGKLVEDIKVILLDLVNLPLNLAYDVKTNFSKFFSEIKIAAIESDLLNSIKTFVREVFYAFERLLFGHQSISQFKSDLNEALKGLQSDLGPLSDFFGSMERIIAERTLTVRERFLEFTKQATPENFDEFMKQFRKIKDIKGKATAEEWLDSIIPKEFVDEVTSFMTKARIALDTGMGNLRTDITNRLYQINTDVRAFISDFGKTTEELKNLLGSVEFVSGEFRFKGKTYSIKLPTKAEFADLISDAQIKFVEETGPSFIEFEYPFEPVVKKVPFKISNSDLAYIRSLKKFFVGEINKTFIDFKVPDIKELEIKFKVKPNIEITEPNQLITDLPAKISSMMKDISSKIVESKFANIDLTEAFGNIIVKSPEVVAKNLVDAILLPFKFVIRLLFAPLRATLKVIKWAMADDVAKAVEEAGPAVEASVVEKAPGFLTHLKSGILGLIGFVAANIILDIAASFLPIRDSIRDGIIEAIDLGFLGAALLGITTIAKFAGSWQKMGLLIVLGIIDGMTGGNLKGAMDDAFNTFFITMFESANEAIHGDWMQFMKFAAILVATIGLAVAIAFTTPAWIGPVTAAFVAVVIAGLVINFRKQLLEAVPYIAAGLLIAIAAIFLLPVELPVLLTLFVGAIVGLLVYKFKTEIWNGIKFIGSELKDAFFWVVGFVQDYWVEIATLMFTGPAGLIMILVSLFGEKIIGAISDFGGALKNGLISAFNWAKDGLIGAAKDIGGWIVDGLKSGIEDALSRIGDWFSDHFGWLNKGGFLGGIAHVLGVNSPSTETAKMGGFLVDGLVKGVDDNKADASTKLANAFSNILNSIATISAFSPRQLEELNKMDFQPFLDSMQKLLDGLKAMIDKTDEGAANKMAGVVKDVLTDVSSGVDTMKLISGKLIEVDQGTLTKNIQTLSDYFNTLVTKLSEICNSGNTKEIKTFSDNAGAAMDLIGKGIDSLAKFKDFTMPDNATIHNLVNSINYIITDISNLAGALAGKPTIAAQFSKDADAVMSSIKTAADTLKGIKDAGSDLPINWGAFTANVKAAVDGFAELNTSVSDKMLSDAGSFANNSTDILTKIGQAATSLKNINQSGTDIETTFTSFHNAITGVALVLTDALNVVIAGVGIVGRIKEEMEKVALVEFKDVGWFILMGIINGLTNDIANGMIQNAAKQIVQNIHNALRQAGLEGSPWKSMEPHGKFALQGILKGFTGQKSAIEKAMDTVVKSVKSRASKFADMGKDAGDAFGTALTDSMGNINLGDIQTPGIGGAFSTASNANQGNTTINVTIQDSVITDEASQRKLADIVSSKIMSDLTGRYSVDYLRG